MVIVIRVFGLRWIRKIVFGGRYTVSGGMGVWEGVRRRY